MLAPARSKPSLRRSAPHRRPGPRLAAALALLALSSAARAQDPDLQAARAAISKLVGYDAVQVGDLSSSKESGVLDVAIGGEGIQAIAFQTQPGSAAWHAAARLGKGTGILGGYMPAALGRPEVTRSLLISVAKDEAAGVSAFPPSIREDVRGFAKSDKVELKAGVNLFLAVRSGPDGVPDFVYRVLRTGPEFLLGGQLDASSTNDVLKAVGFPVPKTLPPETPTSRLALTAIFPGSVPPPFEVIGDKEVLLVENHPLRLQFTTSSKTAAGKSTQTDELSGAQGVTVWLLGRQIEFDTTLAGQFTAGKVTITRTGTAKVRWQDAFGIPGFYLDELSIGGKLVLPEKGKVGLGMDLGAKVGLAKHGSIEGKFGLSFLEDKLSEVQLRFAGTEAGAGIVLGNLPGFDGVPGADQVRFDELSLGINPSSKDVFVSGTVSLVDKQITGRAALVTFTSQGKPAVIAFLQCSGLNLRKLAPTLPEAAEQIGMDRALIAVSSKDFTGLKASTLAGPVKEMLAAVGKDMPPEMRIFKGLTMFLAFDPSNLPGELGKSVREFGVTAPVVLAGSVGGLKDKVPQVSLYVDIPRLPLPDKGFEFVREISPRKGERNVQANQAGGKFFLMLAMAGAGPEVRLGVEGTVGVRVGKEEVFLTGQAFAIVSAIDQGVRLAGRMDGTWKEPFGLAGIEYEDLIVGGGVDASTSIEVALGGTARIGKFDYEMAGLVSLIAASGGLVPEKVAFKYTGSELSMLTQFQLMGAFVKGAVGGPLASTIPPGETKAMLQKVANVDIVGSVEDQFPLPYVKYKDVAFYLVTPGASFPGLQLDGMGVGVQGTFNFLNHDFRKVECSLTLRDGLTLYQNFGGVELGLLSLQDTIVDLRVPMPGLFSDEKPHFKLLGDIDVGCSLLAGAVTVEVQDKVASFDLSTKIADYQTAVHAQVDLAQGKKFLLRGLLPDDLIADVADAVKQELKRQAQVALAAVKAKKAEVQDKVSKGKAALQLAKDKGRDLAVAEVEKKRKEIVNLLNQEVAQSGPVVKQAWKLAMTAVSKVQVAKDGTVAGLNEVRGKLDDVLTAAKKLPGAAASKVQGSIANLKSRADAVASLAQAIPQKVAALPAVQKAGQDLQDAQAQLTDFKQTLVKSKIDPVVAYAGELTEQFNIEEIGFDSDLSVICAGRLPRLNVRGTFAGKPFDMHGVLQLARKQEFHRQNAKDLQALVSELRDLVDRDQAGSYADGLAGEG